MQNHKTKKIRLNLQPDLKNIHLSFNCQYYLIQDI